MIAPASIPGIRGLPIVGNLLAFRGDRLNLLLRMYRECGDMGRMRLGSRTLVLLNAAHHVQTVLVEHADDVEKTPLLRAGLRPVLGNGLLLSEHSFHRQQRKLVAPAFQHRRIALYADVMAQYAEQLAGSWTAGREVDIAHAMTRLTLQIVAKTLFDAELINEADELGTALTTAIHQLNIATSGLLPMPARWRNKRAERIQQAVARLNAPILKIIDERRRSGDDRGDLLSILLQAQHEDDGSSMTDHQVRDEAMTLFLAGHETTANALAWTWYLLSQHPEIYQRLRHEVHSVLDGRTPAFTDLPHLPYTLQVLKESMRLYPPAYVTSRQVVLPFAVDGQHFPVGTLLMISPYVLHRRPDYFPNPERFDPERWEGQREAQLPRHAYLPFGAGPRICIGNQFALMEGHIVLATLAQRVTFELVPKQRIVPEPVITLRPKHGIRMWVYPNEP